MLSGCAYDAGMIKTGTANEGGAKMKTSAGIEFMDGESAYFKDGGQYWHTYESTKF
jgi:hypothetical protein